MKLIPMLAAVAFDHKGKAYRPGQSFSVSAIDAVILQNKKFAKLAKPGTKPDKAKPRADPAPTVASGPVETAALEAGQDAPDADAPDADKPQTSGRGRYRRQDMRAKP